MRLGFFSALLAAQDEKGADAYQNQHDHCNADQLALAASAGFRLLDILLVIIV